MEAHSLTAWSRGERGEEETIKNTDKGKTQEAELNQSSPSGGVICRQKPISELSMLWNSETEKHFPICAQCPVGHRRQNESRAEAGKLAGEITGRRKGLLAGRMDSAPVQQGSWLSLPRPGSSSGPTLGEKLGNDPGGTHRLGVW